MLRRPRDYWRRRRAIALVTLTRCEPDQLVEVSSFNPSIAVGIERSCQQRHALGSPTSGARQALPKLVHSEALSADAAEAAYEERGESEPVTTAARRCRHCSVAVITAPAASTNFELSPPDANFTVDASEGFIECVTDARARPRLRSIADGHVRRRQHATL